MSASGQDRIERLKRLAGVDPNNLSILADLADELIDAGRSHEALSHLDHALAVARADPHFRYRRCVALRRCGKLEEARAELDDLLAHGTRDLVVLFERADLAFQTRDFEEAVRLSKLITQSSDYQHTVPRADLLYVRALHYLGRVEDAIKHAEAVAGSQDECPELQSALATLYLDDERLSEAALVYQTALAKGVVGPELVCVGGYLALAAEDTSLAQRQFSEVLNVRPSDGRALLGAGLASASTGDLGGAVNVLRRAASSMPNHLGTWNALAWMQMLIGDLDEATTTLKRALEVNDSFAETYGAQAVVAAMRGEAEAARNLIRTAVMLDRNCFGAAYAEMILRHGKGSSMAQDAALTFLSMQAAPSGGTMKDAVLRLAQRANASAKRPK